MICENILPSPSSPYPPSSSPPSSFPLLPPPSLSSLLLFPVQSSLLLNAGGLSSSILLSSGHLPSRHTVVAPAESLHSSGSGWWLRLQATTYCTSKQVMKIIISGCPDREAYIGTEDMCMYVLMFTHTHLPHNTPHTHTHTPMHMPLPHNISSHPHSLSDAGRLQRYQ